MASEVFFANLRSRKKSENLEKKVRALLDRAGLRNAVTEGDLVAVKLHFGERGNTTFVSPLFARQAVDAVRELGGNPFLTDTNTLYTGSRSNAVDHLRTAIEHGFNYAVVNAPVLIADGLRGGNLVEVEIGRKHFAKVRIAADIVAANGMVVLSHFKGHMMAGFGGAIKNLAMGCAPVAGKRDQHTIRFRVSEEKCVGCGTCAVVCPGGAVTLAAGKAGIDKALCIGCGECATVCPSDAIEMDWAVDLIEFTEKITEYAFGATRGKEGKILYVNFLTDVTPDCDCVPWSDSPIVPDIGILASCDPVALDAACFDLVQREATTRDSLLAERESCACGHDKFATLWEHTCGRRQIAYGEEIGLGTAAYDLQTL